MAKYKGKLVRVDLGSGGWRLEGKDGQPFDLHGEIPPELEGKMVEVEGEEAQSFGFMMGGASIDVHKIKAVKT